MSPVAELGLGGWQFAGTFGFWDGQTREDSIRTVHAALRGGIRHFDTAQSYGNGRSEQLVGQQLRRFQAEFPRETLTIATKLMPMPPLRIRKAVETSLRRLCTPYLDILYLHWPDSHCDVLPILEAMRTLQTDGLVRQIGVSNFPPDLLQRTCDRFPLDWVQCAGSLLWTRNLARTLDVCRQRSVRIALYSPLGMGLLSGRYRTAADLPEKDARRNLFCFQEDCRASWNELLDILRACAECIGCTPAQIALAWALVQDVSVVVGGARNKSQLAQNLATTALEFPQEMLEELSVAARTLEQSIPRQQDNIFGHAW